MGSPLSQASEDLKSLYLHTSAPLGTAKTIPIGKPVLFSRMAEGLIPFAPVWPDISTFPTHEKLSVDIVYGGFPCQDISVAGNGKGLDGERSGLFFQMLQTAEKLEAPFIFLENSPALRTRGAERVIKELAKRGYDARWDVISAFDVGAPHERKRWYCLAYSDRFRLKKLQELDCEKQESERSLWLYLDGLCDTFSNGDGDGVWQQLRRSCWPNGQSQALFGNDGSQGPKAHDHSLRRQAWWHGTDLRQRCPDTLCCCWWETEPPLARVVHGLPYRVDRVESLGNAVVPKQAREAFERLMGLEMREAH